MATRDDIARLAGVSSATVSRVMNNKGNVSEELKQRVMSAVNELDYYPNITAKGLKSNKSYKIAYLIPDVTNPYYTEIYKGINDYAIREGYSTFLFETSHTDWYKTFYSNQIDGLILGIDIDDKVDKMLKKIQVPVVHQTLFKSNYTSKHFKYITIRHKIEKCLDKAVKLLYEYNNREIALITKKDENKNVILNCYMKALNKYDLVIRDDNIITYENENYNYSPGYRCMKKLLLNNRKINAVLTNNDLVAIGAMSAATELNFSIPNDISFVGINDSIAAKFSNPPLSSIKLYKHKQGLLSAQLLINLINGKNAHSVELNSQLILRKSIKQTKH